MLNVKSVFTQSRLIGLLFVLSIALSGCLGITQPTDTDIKSMAAERFDNDLKGLFIASNVVKKNGYKQNDTHYVMWPN